MNDPRIRLAYQFEAKNQHCEIKCRTCKRTVVLPPAMAVALLGGLSELRRMERRMRCRHCGGRGASIQGVYREHHG